jgi:fumarylacetoacetase
LNVGGDVRKKSIGSWVESANVDGCDFPIENLPFGRYFLKSDPLKQKRIGVAIGDQILDFSTLKTCIQIPDTLQSVVQSLVSGGLNDFMTLPDESQLVLRGWLSRILAQEFAESSQIRSALIPQLAVEMVLPCQIGDYTDFYAGIHHAMNVGKMLRPDTPLAENYTYLPVGYHGRASSLLPSGSQIKRPVGQTRASDGKPPYFQASRRLDYELELGIFIGRGNELGSPIPIESAEDHFFGLCILNDWSARDIQGWESAPLGPFLGKSFATSISAWVVTKFALEPFRCAHAQSLKSNEPLPYLDSLNNRQSGAIQIMLEVLIQTQEMKDSGESAHRLVQSEFSQAAYWTIAQMITHHTSNGCNLCPGDLFGTGTLSGPTSDSAGSLLELTMGGKQKIRLPNGQERSFLESGDTVIMKAYCALPNAVRIGFGDCIGTIL